MEHRATPKRLMGREVSKSFPGYAGTFRGIVKSYRRHGNEVLYRVSYEDGDEEDVAEQELEKLFTHGSSLGPPRADEHIMTSQTASGVPKDVHTESSPEQPIVGLSAPNQNGTEDVVAKNDEAVKEDSEQPRPQAETGVAAARGLDEGQLVEISVRHQGDGPAPPGLEQIPKYGKGRKGRPFGFRPSLHSKAALAATAVTSRDTGGAAAADGSSAMVMKPAEQTPTPVSDANVSTVDMPTYKGKKGRPVGWRIHLHSKQALAARADAGGSVGEPNAAKSPTKPVRSRAPRTVSKVDEHGNALLRKKPGPKPMLDEFGNRVHKPPRPKFDEQGNPLPKLKPGPKPKADAAKVVKQNSGRSAAVAKRSAEGNTHEEAQAKRQNCRGSLVAAVRGSGRAAEPRAPVPAGRGQGGRRGRRPGRFSPITMEDHYAHSAGDSDKEEDCASMPDWSQEVDKVAGDAVYEARQKEARPGLGTRRSTKVLGLGRGLPSPTGRKPHLQPEFETREPPGRQVLGLGGGLPRKQGGARPAGAAAGQQQLVAPAQVIERKELVKGSGALQHQCVVFNGVVYTSPLQADDLTSEEGSTYAGQLEQVLLKLDALLSQAGSSKDRVLSATVYLRSLADGIAALNKLWQLWISSEHLPARAVVESPLHPPACLVQITLVAAAQQR